jgi:hypothetical protein
MTIQKMLKIEAFPKLQFLGDACPATLILIEKAGFRPFFRKPIPKLTEFWDWLDHDFFNAFYCLMNRCW